jgi:hypothetical protein
MHVRPQLFLFALVGATLPVAAMALLLRPAAGPRPLAGPPDSGLAYTKARFTAADARRAFATQEIRLTVKSRMTGVTTLGDLGAVLEVDALADRKTVERTGFSDYTVVGLGASAHYARFARTCAGGALTAERWRGNIRVIVSCAKAGSGAPRLLERVGRALARL